MAVYVEEQNLNHDNVSISEKKSYLIKAFHLLNFFKKILIELCIFYGQGQPKFQMISTILILTASLSWVLYLRPYKNILYTVLKIVAEAGMIICFIFTYMGATKFMATLNEVIISDSDMASINQDGWYAVYFLIVFVSSHTLIFLITLYYDLRMLC